MERFVVLENCVLDETLFNLIFNYFPEKLNKSITIPELEELADNAILMMDQYTSEMISQTKEYPPYMYYVVLDYIDRSKTSVSFRNSTTKEKKRLIDDTVGFLNTLKEEIRESTAEERDLLIQKGKSLYYKEK